MTDRLIFEIHTKALSMNQCYKIGNRNMYTSEAYRIYKAGIINGLKQIPGLKKYEGRIVMRIDIIRKTSRKFDVDNCLKPLLDSLEGYLYNDDEQIVELTITKSLGHAEDMIRITIHTK